MSKLTLKGKVKKVFETNQISDSFKKRDVVIETDDQYPQVVKFELTQNDCSKADDLKEGQELTVHFNVRGREWTNKNNDVVYFVSLQAWRIEKGAVFAPEPTTTIPADDSGDNSELPF